MVDSCGDGWVNNAKGSSVHCFAYKTWRGRSLLSFWKNNNYPLQIGGLAHAIPLSQDHGWRNQPIGTSFIGCISHLRINGEVIE